MGGGRAKGGERVNRLSVVGGAVEVGGKANVERNTITNVQQGMSNIQVNSIQANIPVFLGNSHFLISEENELALFWYLSGEFVDQTRAGFRVVKSGVG